jgi:hypothetical protein
MLFDAGARAQTSGAGPVVMSRTAHIVNLQGMVIYVQRRLGLRIRRVRVLNLKANASVGTAVSTENFEKGMGAQVMSPGRPYSKFWIG